MRVVLITPYDPRVELGGSEMHFGVPFTLEEVEVAMEIQELLVGVLPDDEAIIRDNLNQVALWPEGDENE